MKRNITFAIFFVGVITHTAFSQNASLITAFEKSYQYEAAYNYKQAITEVKGAYEANSYAANVRLGWLYYLLGDFKTSTTYYQKAIDILPYSLEARFGYINPTAALGNWNDVESMYKQILEIDSNNSSANYNLGLIYYNQTNYKEAYKYFEKVVNMYPFDFQSTFMFAWTNVRIGKTREAKVLFNQCLLIAPNSKSTKEALKMLE